jgi:hypothetical protein
MREKPAAAYERLVRELVVLIRKGKGDTEEAEAIVQQTRAPWRAMTDEEKRRAVRLAVELGIGHSQN